MSLAITLPPHPVLLTEISAQPDQVAATLVGLEALVKDADAWLDRLSEEYERFCRLADERGEVGEVDEPVRVLWEHACSWMAMCQRHLAAARQIPRSPYHQDNVAFHRIYIVGLTRHTEQFAEFMRTMAVVWEELELETPDEIYDSVWTVRISPLTYLRAMWNLFWSSIRHPFSDAVIELKTGRILRTE